MKSISKRTAFALIMASVLLFGTLIFAVRYFLYSDQWVVFRNSPHIYNNSGTLDLGTVTDRDGKLLMDSGGGIRYSDDALTRKSVLHLLGDREGMIYQQILPHYSDELVGYDKLNGTYHSVNGEGKCVLTVSAEVQAIAYQALNGRKGTVGVYNYRTGEILCAVTSPSYDPDNVPSKVDDSSGIYINRFINATYTPGSIFKLVTTAAAIETKPELLEKTYTCSGSVTVNGEVITCPKAHGEQSYREALAHSCNCAFAEIATGVGKSVLTEYAKKAGVTDSLEFDGFYTKTGNFDLSRADDNSVAWAGIGQYTDLVNPCAYMSFIGVIGGGGQAAKPYIVDKVLCGDKLLHSGKTVKTGQVLSQTTAGRLAELMEYNTQTVYSSYARFPYGVTVCAKSGTAEVGVGSGNTATFAGFIKDSRYPFAFIVVVEEGGAGSATCAPIAATVLQACINAADK